VTTPPDGRNPGLLPVKPLYGPADAPGDPGEPGRWPFTRGIQPSMYTGRVWTMRQYAGFGTAAETNRRFRELLAAGQTGLSTAFDLPTQMGYDSDHPAGWAWRSTRWTTSPCCSRTSRSTGSPPR
jgi:methylmalonyl-CoA mutase, N-terminal domain